MGTQLNDFLLTYLFVVLGGLVVGVVVVIYLARWAYRSYKDAKKKQTMRSNWDE